MPSTKSRAERNRQRLAALQAKAEIQATKMYVEHGVNVGLMQDAKPLKLRGGEISQIAGPRLDDV